MFNIPTRTGLLINWRRLRQTLDPQPGKLSVLRVSGKLCRGSRILVAASKEARKVGLNHHVSLGRREGLLITKTAKVSTVRHQFPVDIVWVCADSTVLAVNLGVLPSRVPLSGPRGTSSVLLLAADSCKDMGIRPGVGMSLLQH